MSAIQILQRSSIFAGCDETFLHELAMTSSEITLSQGEWLFHEGDEANSLYIVISGAVDLKMAIDTRHTVMADLERITERGLVGWSSLIRPNEYTLGAVAAVESSLLEMDTGHLKILMDKYPESGYLLMYRLAQVCRERLQNMHIRFATLVKI